jgi:hypothetical protein
VPPRTRNPAEPEASISPHALGFRRVLFLKAGIGKVAAIPVLPICNHENSKVMTLDADFVVYRKSRRKVIPLMRPQR